MKLNSKKKKKQKSSSTLLYIAKFHSSGYLDLFLLTVNKICFFLHTLAKIWLFRILNIASLMGVKWYLSVIFFSWFLMKLNILHMLILYFIFYKLLVIILFHFSPIISLFLLMYKSSCTNSGLARCTANTVSRSKTSLLLCYDVCLVFNWMRVFNFSTVKYISLALWLLFFSLCLRNYFLSQVHKYIQQDWLFHIYILNSFVIDFPLWCEVVI